MISMQNDIALIRLIQPLIFNDAVQPARLPAEFEMFNNMTCATSGWGLTSEGIPSYESSTVVLTFISEYS